MLSAITGGIGLIIGCIIGFVLAGRSKKKTDAEVELVSKPVEPDLGPAPPEEKIEEAAEEEEGLAREEEQRQQLETAQDLSQYRGVRIEELETEVRRYRRRASEHLDQLTADLASQWQAAKLKQHVHELPGDVSDDLIKDHERFAEPMNGWMRECGLGSPDMSFQLGLIDALAGNWTDAAICFEKAAFDGLVPQGWLALGDCNWALDRPKKAISSYKKCLQKSRMPIHIFHRSAEVQFSKRKFSETVKILEKILSRKNIPVETVRLAASAYRELGDNEKAVELLEEGLKHNEDDVSLIAGMIIPLSRLGEAKKAEDCAERAGSLDPEGADAPYALGVMHMENSSDDKAIRCFEDALSLRPEFPEVLCGLGIIHNRRLDFKRALEYFEPAVDLNPNYAEAFYNMSASYKEMRNFDRSIAAMNTAVKLNPDYA